MDSQISVELIQEKYQAICSVLDEHSRRLWAAAEAKAIGHGGQTIISKATGLSRRTIYAGLQELKRQTQTDNRLPIRCNGGGRKKLTEHAPTLLTDLEALVDSNSRGDPQRPLRWTCKSTRQLAPKLQKQGHKMSHQKVAAFIKIKNLAYSLQGNRKTKEGSSHSDRNAQFEYINTQVEAFQQRGHPVISVDSKKKELVGDFKIKTLENYGKQKVKPKRCVFMILLIKN